MTFVRQQPNQPGLPAGWFAANAFATLPETFYTRLAPTPLPVPYLVALSKPAAALLGLAPQAFDHPEIIETFAGNRIPDGAAPLAAVYAGHQFGTWAGQLGDGRAILLGDVATGDGPMEVQLKGSGLTPYSRMGDGRAVLRSSIREFLCSEAMAALGIPTSRALCLIGSDLPVQRETRETAAVVTRLAPTFIRFGSFEHWFHHGRPDELRTLADHVLTVHYPGLRETSNPYLALLEAVIDRTARLIARWQAVGFMHGVMNTDNMSIIGLTLDYGPFGFMDGFDAGQVCNSSDSTGRYAYNRQPSIAHWNCYALAEALLPLIGDIDATQQALANFRPIFMSAFDDLLHRKLGLQASLEEDGELFDALFALLQQSRADFTLFFRHLGEVKSDGSQPNDALRVLFADPLAFDAWEAQYRRRLQREGRPDEVRRAAMNAVNPKYVLRNHLLQVAIEKAQQHDFSEVRQLLRVLEKPFDEQPAFSRYAELPPAWARHLKVSCSS